MILGLCLCLTAVHILEHTNQSVNRREKVLRLKVEGILVCSAIFWLTLIFITCLVLRDPKYHDFNITLVGAFSDICSLIFYAAPLALVVEIIKSKNSVTLYAPAIFANLISCILWFFYGLIGVKELIVWIPNGIGAAVCTFELFICWYYPPIFAKDSDGKIVEEYPTSDFAVYASGRHMSNADILFPLMAFLPSSRNDDEDRNSSKYDQNSSQYSTKSDYFGFMKSFKSVLDPIPEAEEKPRTRANTTGDTDYRDRDTGDNPHHPDVTHSPGGSSKI